MTIYDEPTVTTAPPYGGINPGEYKFDEGDLTGQVRTNYEEIRRIEAYLAGQQQDISALSSLSVDWASIGDLYVPDALSTPRVQITTATHGGLAILGAGDTYDDETGTGTYEVLFDYAAATPGLYFADGAAYIGAAGITVSGSGTLNIAATTTDPVVTRIVDVYTAVANTSGSPAVTGIYSRVEKTTADVFSTLYGIRTQVDSAAANGTLLRGINSVVNPGGGTIVTATGVYSQVFTLGTVTNAYGLHVSLQTGSGTLTTGIGLRIEDMAGSNQRAVSIESPASGANNYAIYSSAAAQSVHAGNFRIGSTTAPTVALHVTGQGLFDESVNGNTQVLISNGNAGTAAGAAFNVVIPATSTTGDAYFSATIAATKSFSWGIDNSDSDAWVLSENASLGTSNRIRALGSSVELLTTAKATANGWYIKGGTAAYGTDGAGVLLDGAFDTAGTDLAVNMIHSAVTGAGNAVFTLSTHPGGTGDPQVHFRISGTQSWRVGIDNSDSDAFIVSRGTGLGTNNTLRISVSDEAHFLGRLGVGVSPTVAGRLFWSQFATAGTGLEVRHEHTDNTNAASHAQETIIVGGASGGDPFLNFRVAGNTDWSMGIDNSVANDPFVLARSTALGTTNIASFLAASVTLADPYDVVLGSTTGTKIGTATTQKLGFYNATPIVRPSAYTQTYATADKTHANDGSADFPAGGVGTAAGGWNTAANRDLAITRFNALRVTVTDLKQLVNSIIDDLQALGLVG